MVADRSRGRLIALWFLAMLLLSVVPAIAPTAAAAAGAPTIQSVTATIVNGAGPVATTNSQIWLVAQVDPPSTSGCVLPGYNPVVEVRATPGTAAAPSANRIGYSSNQIFTQRGSSNLYDLNLTVGDPVGTIAPLNDSAHTITVAAQTTCRDSSGAAEPGNTASASPTAQSTSFRLDNSRPTAAFQFTTTPTPGRVGSTLRLELTSLSDVHAATVDLTRIGGSAATPLANPAPGSVYTWTIGETAIAPSTPLVLHLKDDRDNANSPTAPLERVFTTAQLDTVRPQPVAGLLVTPRPGGSVEVSFSPSADDDLATNGYAIRVNNSTRDVTFPVTQSANVTNMSGASPPWLYNLTANNFDLATPTAYEISVVATDSAGNVGYASAEHTVTPSTMPNAVSFDPSIPLTGSAWPVLTGTWSATSETPTTARHIRVLLSNYSAARAETMYWHGSGTDFRATPYWIWVDNVNNPDGSRTWTAANFTNGSTSSLLDGAYNFTAEFVIDDVNNPVYTTAPRAFTIDKGPPVPATPLDPGDNAIRGTPNFGVRQGVDPISVKINYTDLGVGIETIRFFLTEKKTNDPNATRVGTTTQPVVHTYTPLASEKNHVNRVISFVLPDAPLGTYGLNVSITDGVGNTVWRHLRTPDINIVPRVVVPADDSTPFADASGVRLQVFAAYTNKSSVSPYETNCGQLTCVPTIVYLQAKNRTAADSTAINIGQALSPRPGIVHYPSATSPAFYDYSPTGAVSLETLDPEWAVVRAVVRVQREASGHFWENSTEWIRVRTGEFTGGIEVLNVLDNATVFMDGRNRTAHFNVSYEQQGLASAPTIEHYVKVLNDTAGRAGQYVRLTGSVPADGMARYFATAGEAKAAIDRTGPGTGPRYYWNFSNNGTLPRGEYRLNLTLTTPEGVKWLERDFGVESVSPQVLFNESLSEIYQGGYVKRRFNVTVDISHGFANVTQQSVSSVLGETRGTGIGYIAPGTSNFSATIAEFKPAPNNTWTQVKYEVQLPDNAIDGKGYFLFVNVSTQSSATGGRDAANDSRFRIVTVDLAAPLRPRVTMSVTNASGTNLASELYITGTAEDYGAGIGGVAVRIINMSNGPSTFVWNGSANGRFQPGILDSWLSSSVLLASDGDWVQNVRLQQSGSGCSVSVTCWTVYDENRTRLTQTGATAGKGDYAPIGLDRNHTYRIDVRAFDNLGTWTVFDPQTHSFPVSFDALAPNVSAEYPLRAASASDPAADTYVDWHGHGNLTVAVGDNNCLARVSLVGTAPGGGNASRIDFTRPAAAVCGPASGNTMQNWTLNLFESPLATQLVGAYNYTVEAVDAAGRTTISPHNITLRVNDTQKALVRTLYPTPPVVGVDTRSTIIAEIEEWGQIEQVRVFFDRLEGTQTQRVAEGVMRFVESIDENRTSGNGTMYYIATTDEDLNVTELPVGYYVWTVRAMDTNWESTCVVPGDPNLQCSQHSDLVQVTADAAPAIQLLSPSATSPWINGTPSFRFRVDNYPGGTEGITVLAGNSSSALAAVNLTALTPIRTVSGNVTGAFVYYNTTAESGNFSIRVRAVGANGFSNQTPIHTFLVDADAPSVTSNVTGMIERGNTTWFVSSSRIAFEAQDDVSNVSSITYRVGNGTPRAYSAPFALSSGEGETIVTFTATDGAGNVNTSTLTVNVDFEGPEVRVVRPADDLLFVVEDGGIGVDDENVTVHYAYGEATGFSQVAAARETVNSFAATLPGNATAEGLRYYIVARDLFGNVAGAGSAADPLVVEKVLPPDDDGNNTPPPPVVNRAPTVRIIQPAAGADVRGEVVLQWEAADEDGDDLQVNLALQEPRGPGQSLQSDADARGTFPLNLSNSNAGAYTFVVVVTDGNETARAHVTFNVLDGETIKTVTPPPTTAKAGETVPFTVKIQPAGKTVSGASYELHRDGERVAAGPMQANGDVYAASVTPDAPGEYEVFVRVAYADGGSDGPTSLGSFVVAGTTVTPPAGGGGLSIGFISLLALAVATMALSAGGAFWRWKK